MRAKSKQNEDYRPIQIPHSLEVHGRGGIYQFSVQRNHQTELVMQSHLCQLVLWDYAKHEYVLHNNAANQ